MICGEAREPIEFIFGMDRLPDNSNLDPWGELGPQSFGFYGNV